MSTVEAAEASVAADRGTPAIEAIGIARSFGKKQALDDVSLRVERGEIHALLGPNGAGKTTLVRILIGLADPDRGTVRLLGRAGLMSRETRSLIGYVPSGDRTFYQRISGYENLLFFARLHGIGRRAARGAALRAASQVGLDDAIDVPVGQYSHGMQKRLSVARGLLVDPPVLFVDEATHDLDPAGARRIHQLVAAAAERGTAVIWTTQRVDEIRGFADRVTVLRRGNVRFNGTVPQLMAVTAANRFLVRLHGDGLRGEEVVQRSAAALGASGSIAPGPEDDGEHFLLSLREDVSIGWAAARLLEARIDMLACREERSAVETAFLYLTEDDA